MIDGLYNNPNSRMVGDIKFSQYEAINPQVAEAWRAEGGGVFLSDLTWVVAERLGYGGEVPGGPIRSDRGGLTGQAAKSLLDSLDSLSDEEVEALLEGELARGEQEE